MKNNVEFNEIKSNNADQLNPKPYYTSNNIGSSANKIGTQMDTTLANEAGSSNKSAQDLEIDSTEKTKKKSSDKSADIAKLVTKFVAVISAAVVGTTTLSEIFVRPTTLVATFEDVYATQNEISYYVYIEDTTMKERESDYNYEWESLESKDVYLVLENDFTNRSQKLIDYYVEGTFEDLQENMEYTILVKVGDYVIGSTTVRTAAGRYSYNDDKPSDPDPTTADDPDEEPESDDPTQTNGYDPTNNNSNNG